MRLGWNKVVDIMKEYPNVEISEFTIMRKGRDFSIEIYRSKVNPIVVADIWKRFNSSGLCKSIKSVAQLLEALKEPN